MIGTYISKASIEFSYSEETRDFAPVQEGLIPEIVAEILERENQVRDAQRDAKSQIDRITKEFDYHARSSGLHAEQHFHQYDRTRRLQDPTTFTFSYLNIETVTYVAGSIAALAVFVRNVLGSIKDWRDISGAGIKVKLGDKEITVKRGDDILELLKSEATAADVEANKANGPTDLTK